MRPVRYVLTMLPILLALTILPSSADAQRQASSYNYAPIISGSPSPYATVGFRYTFQPSARDANGDLLTFSISNKPEWATFSAKSGLLTGIPSIARSYTNIVVSVSDGRKKRSLPAYTLKVTNSSSGSSSSSSVSSSSNSSSSSSNSSSSTGVSSSSSSSAAASSSSSSAAPINAAPSISGTPATSVTVGTPYSFKPSAADANGDVLGFSISGKPAWTSFNTSTGSLTGTPTGDNIGSFAGIIISVSDGKASASLNPFTVAVVAAPVATGSAALNWTRPTLNTDGSPLTDLASYKIYYGTSSSSLPNSVVVSSDLTNYTINSLSKGTWYFAISSITSSGVEGNKSNVASKTI